MRTRGTRARRTAKENRPVGERRWRQEPVAVVPDGQQTLEVRHVRDITPGAEREWKVDIRPWISTTVYAGPGAGRGLRLTRPVAIAIHAALGRALETWPA